MLEKTEKIRQGIFDFDPSRLRLSKERLDFSVAEKERYRGSFEIEAEGGREIRGFVRCPDFNMRYGREEFSGSHVRISFVFISEGLSEGDIIESYFAVISDVGEYILPYRVRVVRHYPRTSIGIIKTIKDYANLAMLNVEEAADTFFDPDFPNIFGGDEELTLLYKGLCSGIAPMRAVEEFLIGSGIKARPSFRLSENELTLCGEDEFKRAKIRVEREGWGQTEIRVSCAQSWVRLSKKRLDAGDFEGRHAEVYLRVLPQMLHGGRNYARIVFESAFERMEMELSAIEQPRAAIDAEEGRRKRKNKLLRCRLEQLHLSREMGEIEDDVYAGKMIELLGEWEAGESGREWVALAEAYARLRLGELEQARSLLRRTARMIRDPHTPAGVFFMYLHTELQAAECDARNRRGIAERDEERKERQKELDALALRTEEVYQVYPSNPLLPWILLKSDKKLSGSPAAQYDMIRAYMSEHSASPILYLMAAKLLLAHPELLKDGGEFEDRLLIWMMRKRLFRAGLARGVISYAQRKRKWNEGFFSVMADCCEIMKNKQALGGICSYLIRMGRYGREYLPWYEKGVRARLRTTGLFEAYLRSWSRDQGDPPEEVLKYFALHGSLPAKRKANLLAYIALNREEIGEDWEAYMVLLGNFAAGELQRGNISEDLAVLYETMRERYPDEWEKIGTEMRGYYRISGIPASVKRIWAVEKEGETLKTVTSAGCAYLPLGGAADAPIRGAVLLGEDSYGHIYSLGRSCRIEKVMGKESPSDLKAEHEHRAEEAERARDGEIDIYDLCMEEMMAKVSERRALGRDVRDASLELMRRMLFTDKWIEGHLSLFEQLSGGEEAVCEIEAYLSRFSYFYIMDMDTPGDAAFDCLLKIFKDGREINGFATAALLKKSGVICTERDRSGECRDAGREAAFFDAAEKILSDFLSRGMYFDFYSELPARMRRRYMLDGLSVISKNDRPGEVLFTSDGTELKEVLPGIYTVPRIFAGKEPGSVKICKRGGEEAGRAAVSPIMAEGGKGRSGEMGRLNFESAEDTDRYAYAEMSDMADALFWPIKEES